MKNVSQRRRAQIGLYTVVILNLGVYIWSIVMQARFNSSSPGKIDWDEALYPSAFLPYFFVQTTGPLSQSYMYWLLSSFATDAQGKWPILLDTESSKADKGASQRSEWRCFPLSRSRWPSDRLRHEY